MYGCSFSTFGASLCLCRTHFLLWSATRGRRLRVPVSEMEARQNLLAKLLQENDIEAALVQNPVDLYYYSGGRQNASLLVKASGESRLFVRRSLSRAKFESGEDDSPHSVENFPRMAEFSDTIGCIPAMQFGELPHTFADKFANRVGATKDCTSIIHGQREVKSPVGDSNDGRWSISSVGYVRSSNKSWR